MLMEGVHPDEPGTSGTSEELFSGALEQARLHKSVAKFRGGEHLDAMI